jgi:hypothetical protein
MKFAMGAETLTVLTTAANEDLGSLVKQLFPPSRSRASSTGPSSCIRQVQG